jgi:hypothetical protein
VLVSRGVGKDGVSRAKEAVAQLKPRDATARWADALAHAQRQMTKEDVNRLVVLVTDLQDKDWTEETQRALENLLRLPSKVRIVDVGGARRRNLTVSRVTIPMRRDAFVGRPLRLAATIENQGSEPVLDARVSVLLDDNPTPLRSIRAPELPAFDASTKRPGSETVVFELSGRDFQEPGSHILTVTVTPPGTDADSDSLALDSRRGLAIHVRDRIHVAAWTRSSQGATPSAETYLRGIFDRFSRGDDGRRVERGTLYELTPVTNEVGFLETLRGARPPIDLVVLANVAPRSETADALRAFVRAGGALMTFTGDAPALQDPAALNDLFWERPDRRLLPRALRDREVRDRSAREEPFRLDLEADTAHPLAAPFTGPDAQGWIGLLPPAIWGRFPFAKIEVSGAPDGGGPTGAPDAQTDVLYYEGPERIPFAVEGQYGSGKTLWIGTSLDNGWLDQGLPFFLPVFLDEAAVYLTRPDEARLNLEVGRRLVITWLPSDAEDVRVVGPGGQQLTPTRYEAKGALDRPTWVQDRVGTAGAWTLSYEAEAQRGRTQRVEERFAVNVDPVEGRLFAADVDALRRRQPAEADFDVMTSWGDLQEKSGEAQEGEIASTLLWIAFGLLFLESLLAWIFGRQQGSTAPAAGGPA